MEEQLLNNGFTIGDINGTKMLSKENVDVIFNQDYGGGISYTPRITYHFTQSNLTPFQNNIQTIQDLNALLDHYRDKHEGEWKFIDNLIEY